MISQQGNTFSNLAMSKIVQSNYANDVCDLVSSFVLGVKYCQISHIAINSLLVSWNIMFWRLYKLSRETCFFQRSLGKWHVPVLPFARLWVGASLPCWDYSVSVY